MAPSLADDQLKIEETNNLQQFYSLSPAAFVVQHNLSHSAKNDLCRPVKAMAPENENVSNLAVTEIFGPTTVGNITCVHYCKICENTFVEDSLDQIDVSKTRNKRNKPVTSGTNQ